LPWDTSKLMIQRENSERKLKKIMVGYDKTFGEDLNNSNISE